MRRLLLTLAILSLIACKSFNPVGPTPSDGVEPAFVQTRACLQVGFGAYVDKNDLNLAKDLGFEVVRHDVQNVSPSEVMKIISDTRNAGLEPLLIITDGNQLRELPSEVMYELKNEPDLEFPNATHYHEIMVEAAEVAKERNQILYVGVISNLNDRGFDYLKAIRPFPENVRISVHRYGDGTFTNPHRGFDSRYSEVKWLRETIGDKQFGVSEFGYPTNGLGESDQAYRTQQEFEFWHGKSDFTCLYQINDGKAENESYGIRRIDGSLKPNAQVIRNIR